MGFFSYDPVPESSPYFLQQFSPPHVAAIGILLILVAAVIVFRKRLAAWTGERGLRMAFMTLAILCEVSLHVLVGLQRGWVQFITTTIPLDICAICFWLAVTVHCTGNRFIYDLVYFWGWGAAASFLFADTGGAGWNTWHFYQYFISHGFTLLTMTWFAAVRGYHPTVRSLLRAAGILLPLSFVIRLIDISFRTEPWKLNYSFLAEPPGLDTPFAAFGTGWGYYGKIVGFVAGILVISWMPWGIATAVRRLREARKPKPAA